MLKTAYQQYRYRIDKIFRYRYKSLPFEIRKKIIRRFPGVSPESVTHQIGNTIVAFHGYAITAFRKFLDKYLIKSGGMKICMGII